jgi:hypothetical protein
MEAGEQKKAARDAADGLAADAHLRAAHALEDDAHACVVYSTVTDFARLRG